MKTKLETPPNIHGLSWNLARLRKIACRVQYRRLPDR